MIIHSAKLLGGDEHGAYEYTTPGTYQLVFKRRTKASIWMVGGGAAASTFRSTYGGVIITFRLSGGSGAGFVGEIYVPMGLLTIKVGGVAMDDSTNNDTSISNNTITGNLITAGGAIVVSTLDSASNQGRLTVSLNTEIVPGSVILETDGNYGTTGSSGNLSGGASVYNGYGRGSDCLSSQAWNTTVNTNGTPGYFKIVY